MILKILKDIDWSITVVMFYTVLYFVKALQLLEEALLNYPLKFLSDKLKIDEEN